jgi:DNA adenine methylase
MARSSTTYPKKWNNQKTTVIRVPEVIVEDLLRIARHLDCNAGFRLREDTNTLTLELNPATKVRYGSDRPVNVSSVPQRSPFRYPGGKTWLVPYIRDWLRSRYKEPKRLVEPFAGGAIVSLTAGFEGLSKHVIFSELDPEVASVWRIVLNGQSEWLATKILNFDLSEETARAVLQGTSIELRERAFRCILRNRVQRGGIMAWGAGLVKTGENGRGIKSRWYPETLARRIREINSLKDRFSFIEGDGFNLIREHQSDTDTVFYIDPPYTKAARRLYSAWEVDHRLLFKQLSYCKGDFLMSYDSTAEVISLAEEFGFHHRAIAMKNTHHAEMTELLIGRNLSWIKS